MPTERPHVPPESLALDRIKVVPRPNGSYLICPARPTDTFAPFELPPISQTVVYWLIKFAERFWEEHQRCVGVLLLLDVHNHSWHFEIPKQECSADSACWSIAKATFPNLDSKYHLAGILQSRVFGDNESLTKEEIVPAVDGCHIVVLFMPDGTYVSICLRIGQAVGMLERPNVLPENYDAFLAANSAKLTLV